MWEAKKKIKLLEFATVVHDDEFIAKAINGTTNVFHHSSYSRHTNLLGRSSIRKLAGLGHCLKKDGTAQHKTARYLGSGEEGGQLAQGFRNGVDALDLLFKRVFNPSLVSLTDNHVVSRIRPEFFFLPRQQNLIISRHSKIGYLAIRINATSKAKLQISTLYILGDSPANLFTDLGWRVFFIIWSWTKLTMSGRMGALKTAGKWTPFPTTASFFKE